MEKRDLTQFFDRHAGPDRHSCCIDQLGRVIPDGVNAKNPSRLCFNQDLQRHRDRYDNAFLVVGDEPERLTVSDCRKPRSPRLFLGPSHVTAQRRER